jgi:iron(II)-dependent oxidoreductase
VREILDAMEAVRRRTLDLVGHLTPADLERQIDPIMSPLVWDLAHIAAYEDLWLVHRFAGEPLLRPELAARYDAFVDSQAASREAREQRRAAKRGVMEVPITA